MNQRPLIGKKSDLDNLIKGKLLGGILKKISEESLIPWKSVTLKKVDWKISKLKARIKPFGFNPILKQIDVINCIEALHKKFVLVPISKAFNNVAVICKRYYAEIILNETGVIGHENNTLLTTTLATKLVKVEMR